MADVSDIQTDETPDAIEHDEDLEVDADEETDTADASLDDLYENEMVAEQAAGGAVDEDEEFIVKAMESAGEEPTETLTTKVRPRASGEFQCQECFLIKPATQLADAKNMLCIDCV